MIFARKHGKKYSTYLYSDMKLEKSNVAFLLLSIYVRIHTYVHALGKEEFANSWLCQLGHPEIFCHPRCDCKSISQPPVCVSLYQGAQVILVLSSSSNINMGGAYGFPPIPFCFLSFEKSWIPAIYYFEWYVQVHTCDYLWSVHTNRHHHQQQPSPHDFLGYSTGKHRRGWPKKLVHMYGESRSAAN